MSVKYTKNYNKSAKVGTTYMFTPKKHKKLGYEKAV